MSDFLLTLKDHRHLLLGLWLLLVAGVIIGSLEPQIHMPAIYQLDKLIHMSAYFIISALPTLLLSKPRWRITACLTILALGGLIEILQGMIPGRDASTMDFVADLLGVSAGYMAGLFGRHLLKRLIA